MDELNKNQLILLALLVSFVTSIATSIATASLLEQAPPKVTQTIQRVVERTVETVTPDGPSTSVITENTVIVREEDAITEAIAQLSPSLVRMYLSPGDIQQFERRGDDEVEPFRGIAIAHGGAGDVILVSKRVAQESFSTYEAVLADGNIGTAVVESRDETKGVTTFTLVVPDGVTLPGPAVLGDSTGIKLGQTLLGLGGETQTSVSIGIVSNVVRDGSDLIRSIEASFASDVDGMPVVNLFGEIVGFADAAGSTSFLSVNHITAPNSAGS